MSLAFMGLRDQLGETRSACVPNSGCTAQKSATSYPQSTFGLGKRRAELDGVDAEPVEVLGASTGRPWQVAEAVAVRVGERAHVDLVDDRA